MHILKKVNFTHTYQCQTLAGICAPESPWLYPTEKQKHRNRLQTDFLTGAAKWNYQPPMLRYPISVKGGLEEHRIQDNWIDLILGGYLSQFVVWCFIYTVYERACVPSWGTGESFLKVKVERLPVDWTSADLQSALSQKKKKTPKTVQTTKRRNKQHETALSTGDDDHHQTGCLGLLMWVIPSTDTRTHKVTIEWPQMASDFSTIVNMLTRTQGDCLKNDRNINLFLSGNGFKETRSCFWPNQLAAKLSAPDGAVKCCDCQSESRPQTNVNSAVSVLTPLSFPPQSHFM